MEIEKLVSNRRIIKKFKPDAVDINLIKSWLSLASMAPNHRLNEPWEILFVGPEARKKINHKTNFGNASIVIAILSNQGKSIVERNENMVAVSCFIQNFMLLAWDSGIGTSWSSLGVSETVRSALNVHENYIVVGIFGVGYPEEIPIAKDRTPIEKKIRHIN